jgi:hypothetical protein
LARRHAHGQTFGKRAENIRADLHQAATENWGPRSIECEFDHLFLVAPHLTIGHARADLKTRWTRLARRNAHWQSFGKRAENIRADLRQAAPGSQGGISNQLTQNQKKIPADGCLRGVKLKPRRV